MKLLCTCLLFLCSHLFCLAIPQSDSLSRALGEVIENAGNYDRQKLQSIDSLQEKLSSLSGDASTKYKVYEHLYDEYKSYKYDFALYFANKLKHFALLEKNETLLTDARLKEIFVTLSGGLYKEAIDSLNAISLADISDSIKAEFYTLKGITYYNLADYNGASPSGTYYNQVANVYLDFAVSYYGDQSFEKLYYSSLRYLKQNHADSALNNLQLLLSRHDLTNHQIALTTSTIGGIYISRGEETDAKPYLIRASIADIKSSTKETLALLTLAGIVYKEGDVELAFRYIEKANEDATFYNARLRKVQIGAILPLIEGGMISTINNQKQKLQFFLVALSLLVLLLAGFALIIRSQVKKLKLARESLFATNGKLQQSNNELLQANELKERYNRQLSETNHQLVEANETSERYNAQLQKTNQLLTEANRIKEEYIGYYFNLDTEYIARFEKLVTTIDKKLTERKWEEIKFILKTVDAKKEKDELLRSFDKVFIRLFPNFVAQFNSLFSPQDQVVVKDDQLLNTELRIFALIRMGITDNEKIAEILGYSINTIYAKKTKVRSKTLVNKEEFERRITEITTIIS